MLVIDCAHCAHFFQLQGILAENTSINAAISRGSAAVRIDLYHAVR
jgi:hypothetical protein